MGRGTPIRLTAALVERGESGGKPPPSKMPGWSPATERENRHPLFIWARSRVL